MNRLDRLYALAEALRAAASRSRTARQLADRFEVSTRTIERDLLALQEAGVPVWSTPGPGGGYTVDPSMTLPPVNFTADEATAVAVALATGAATPFADAARSAMSKLAAAMSAPEREAAHELAGRITLLGGRRDRVHDAMVGTIAGAVARHEVVCLDYVDRDDRPTARHVEAHGLAVNGEGVWYLLGWCRLRDDERIFRLDRVRHAERTGELAAPRQPGPAPFPVAKLALLE
jgi:predicted DNA-binding transcriptional regulator YafY